MGPRMQVVDLTSGTQRLASRLQEAHLKCSRDQRDSLLYYILVHPTAAHKPPVSVASDLSGLLHLLPPASATALFWPRLLHHTRLVH